MTNELGLAWLKHFDAYTKSRTVRLVRLLILDGYESYNSKEFKDYCRDNKIVTLCIPLHLLYLLQLLDVGCFASLKKAYGR
jgi:hypothetical protein